MFIGHYGVSFAVKARDKSIPLWVLFLAVQFLDVLWGVFVLAGIERLRITPGFTRTNPLDLYYMPYTHSLIGALGWSALGFGIYMLMGKVLSQGQDGLVSNGRITTRTVTFGALLVGFAVFSHWLLDLIVHRPDLPLYDDSYKVGLGLWDYAAVAFGV